MFAAQRLNTEAFQSGKMTQSRVISEWLDLEPDITKRFLFWDKLYTKKVSHDSKGSLSMTKVKIRVNKLFN